MDSFCWRERYHSTGTPCPPRRGLTVEWCLTSTADRVCAKPSSRYGAGNPVFGSSCYSARARGERRSPPRRIQSPDPESGSLPKLSGDFLLHGYMSNEHFRKDPISFFQRYGRNCEKYHISQCRRILRKISGSGSKPRMTSKIL